MAAKTYAVGSDNTVLRRDNHSGPWIDVSPSVGSAVPTWNDVMSNSTNPDFVVVVGSAGLVPDGGQFGIHVSNDAGLTWSTPSGNWRQTDTFQEVWIVDNNVIWVVGESGIVVKSTDAGLSFSSPTVLPSSKPGLITGGDVLSTSAIFAIDDTTAVVAGSPTSSTEEAAAYVWKTIDGGNSWFLLNGGVSLVNTTVPTNPVGSARGIWMSPDQATLIVGTGYTQNLSTDGGTTFVGVGPEILRSGLHLTWFPTYNATPNYFRNVGGAVILTNQSADIGATWSTTVTSGTVNPPGITMKGAHYYSDFNGYYVSGDKIYTTTDGGLNASENYDHPTVIEFNAVWTSEVKGCVLVTPCDSNQAPLVISSSFIQQYIGTTIKIAIDAGDTINICATVTTTADCTEAQPWPTTYTVLESFTDCDTCSPPPPDDKCWDLISCDGTCIDILGVNNINFDGLTDQLITLSSSPDCVYLVKAVRQAFYTAVDLTSVLSNPAGAFQLGTDSRTYTMTSLIHNGTQHITGTSPSIVMNVGNYQATECTGLTCNVVIPNTTENGFENFSTFLQAQFTNLSLSLEAFPNDPANDPATGPTALGESFRINYHDGDTFQIVVEKVDNTGLDTYLFSLAAGNITERLLDTVADPTSDTSDVYCLGQDIGVQKINAFIGVCPTPPTIEFGEACEIVPRLGEPGFSWKNCDPEKVISVKLTFADSVYALYKQMCYGIKTCCEFDLDRIEIKNSLLDLGRLLDPDLCVVTELVEEVCCVAPIDVLATLITPIVLTCPAPIDAVTLFTPGAPVVQCTPPIEVSTVLTITP